jgi:hypothetical protein
VSLVEMTFPFNWYNIKEDYPVKIIGQDNKTFELNEIDGYSYTPALKKGYYTPRTLMTKINRELLLHSVTLPPQLEFDENTGKVILITGHNSVNGTVNKLLPHIPKELRKILGFEKILEYRYGQYIGSEPLNLDYAFQNLYVYCDIIQAQFVGNRNVPLLRVVDVPADAKFGSSITKVIKQPHYIPVANNEIETIEVHIKDSFNETIPFNGGYSRIKLHFRHA